MDRIDGYRLGQQLAALEREEEWEPFLRARLLSLRREAAQNSTTQSIGSEFGRWQDPVERSFVAGRKIPSYSRLRLQPTRQLPRELLKKEHELTCSPWIRDGPRVRSLSALARSRALAQRRAIIAGWRCPAGW